MVGDLREVSPKMCWFEEKQKLTYEPEVSSLSKSLVKLRGLHEYVSFQCWHGHVPWADSLEEYLQEVWWCGCWKWMIEVWI